MIARLITRTKSIRRQSRQFLIKSSTKCQNLVDKYQLVKKLLLLGTLTNLYFCYTSFVRFSIYNQISIGITDKFNQWNLNQNRNKQMIFQLMKQMETMKTQKHIDNTQNQNITPPPIVQQSNQQQTKDKKQEKNSSSFFSFFKGGKDKQNQKKDEYI